MSDAAQELSSDSQDSDVVDRLRLPCGRRHFDKEQGQVGFCSRTSRCGSCKCQVEAADEIQRLRGVLREIRAVAVMGGILQVQAMVEDALVEAK